MKSNMEKTINIWKLHISRNPFKSLFRKIKYSIQRIKYGFCDIDTWNLDTYFSSVIPVSIRQMARETIGFPPEFSIDDFEDDSSALLKWQTELNRIANLIEIGGSYIDPEEFVESPMKELDKFKEMEERNQKSLEEGLLLLAKYYKDLWW